MQLTATLPRLATGLLLGLSAIIATPVAAQTYNQHLDATWSVSKINCSESLNAESCDYTGINGLTYDAIDKGGTSGNNNDEAIAAVVQPDGKLVVGGNVYNGTYTICAIRRYLPDGSVDATFGYNNTSFYSAADSDCNLHTLALQNDGSIYVGGQLHDRLHGTNSGFVFHLLSNGSLDPAFRPSDIGHRLEPGDDVEQILINDDNIIVIGSSFSGSSDDFMAIGLTSTGDLAQPILFPAFDFGGDNNDRASAGVLESFLTTGLSGGNFVFHHNKELYVVGTANAAAWTVSHPNSNCAIVAYRSVDGGAWTLDTNFDNSGKLNFGSPIIYASGQIPNTQTLCYTAMALPQPIGPFGAGRGLSGIVVGGERYFNHVIYPFSADPYDNSAFGLAEIAASGQVSNFFSNPLDASYRDLFGAGDYNSIRGIVRQLQGKYLVAGLAGTGNTDHAPSDMGTMMMDSSFNIDPNWGSQGKNLLSIDGAPTLCYGSQCSLQNGAFFPSAEAASTVVLDARRGRAYAIGERDNSVIDTGNDWLIGSMRVSDRIFADNLDGTSPND